jgi:hypothetical protein
MATGRLYNPVQLGATSNTTVYVVPTGYYSVFNVSMTNTSSSSVTIRLAVASTATPGTAEWIEYDTVIVPKGVFERTGLVLDSGKYVVAYASTGSAVNVTVYGIETSVV